MLQDKYEFLQEPLNFPSFEFKIQNDEEGRLMVFDSLRKKFLVLTPEEWVRQHIVQVLLNEYSYPKSLFAVEKGLKYNTLQKRFDVLVYNRSGAPFLLIECKAPGVKLSQLTLSQVCTYNQTIQAPYLGITNGKQHIFLTFDTETNKYVQISDLPTL
ncbi:type I restriction enzyme HsdR N-terminal domain-containing protein [Belliella sp. DSM 111904]|uniref:Type I restriction enzyme HsdR N-terminal domain-containing protein n=1 Tax=Belliella filtrata TaxID=2923435 RepID=A0ABS9V281_9BACT|nr:type I restriction enzyme HsdR N-terminal domain-containing protein [Belliella filtrata]MCH7410095.1 type I restriction enzyme HsdR N-terminal domain-containing protein [Belliella filtrata]